MVQSVIMKRNCTYCNREIIYTDTNKYNTHCRTNPRCPDCSNYMQYYGLIEHSPKVKKPKELIPVITTCERCGKIRTYKSNHSYRATRNQGSKHCVSCANILKPQPLVNKNKGKHIHTDATKQKFRQQRIDQMKASGQARIYNRHCCDVLNAINISQQCRGIHFQHALNGGEVDRLGFYADGYDTTNNIWFEWDEARHFNKGGILKPKDVTRMNYIIQNLNPEFWRYDEERNLLKQCNPNVTEPMVKESDIISFFSNTSNLLYDLLSTSVSACITTTYN